VEGGKEEGEEVKEERAVVPGKCMSVRSKQIAWFLRSAVDKAI